MENELEFVGKDARKVFHFYWVNTHRFSNLQASGQGKTFFVKVKSEYYRNEKQLLGDIEKAANSPRWK